MNEQNQDSPLKPGEKFGGLRREYTPLRKKAQEILEQIGVAEAPFRKARARFAREFLERQRTSDIDSVTGLPVRRLFEERLEQEVQRAKRYHHPLTMVLVDVNNLKEINDTQGGLLAGDTVLKQVADKLTESVRRTDFVARYGGDEYAVLFPETPLTGIDAWWERFKETMKGASCTVSTGATEVNLENVEETRKKLSGLLLQAKKESMHLENVISIR